MAKKSSAVTKEEARNIFELNNGQDGNGSASTLDILSKMSGTTTAKTKSKVPVITDKDFIPVADVIINLSRQIKDLKTRYDIEEAKLLSRAWVDYEKNKGLQASFKIQGTSEAPMIVFKNQFKQVPLENKEVLQKTLKDNYSKFFTDVYEITLKDTSVEKIDALIKLVGADKFQELFEIKKSYIKPCDTMNNLQFELPKELRPYVEQYKGSVKI